MDAYELTETLGGRWSDGRSTGSARCPAHDDRHASLSVSDRDGKLLVKCHANCSQEAVIAALTERGLWGSQAAPLSIMRTNGTAALKPIELEPQPAKGQAKGPTKIEAVYDYTDEQGNLLFQVVRKVPKEFPARRPDGKGGWIYNLDGVRRVLYHLPELIRAPIDKPVFITEGEKDVDRLRYIYLVATTNPGGAGKGKWLPSFNAYLKNRHVVILPDNDQAGFDHAQEVANALLPVAASVKLVTLPGLNEKEDVSDWFDIHRNTRPDLFALVEQTAPLPKPEPAYPIVSIGELVRLQEHEDAQVVEGIIWARRLTWAFANPGAGKTLFLLAALMHVAAGRPFLGRSVRQGPVLILEEDSPLSVLSEYVELLADIYEFDLETLPFYVNRVQGLRITDEAELQTTLDIIYEVCPVRPSVVLFDAAEAIIPSEKFNTKELDPFRRLLQRLMNDEITPLVIDHTNRARTAKGDTKPSAMETLFGARVKMGMSDVMLYFDGDLKSGAVAVNFAKFRGEAPPGFTLEFHSDNGFTITDRPRTTQSPSEQAIMRYFNNARGAHSLDEVVEHSGVRRRTATRALTALVSRRWLIRDGSTTATVYRPNTEGPSPFR